MEVVYFAQADNPSATPPPPRRARLAIDWARNDASQPVKIGFSGDLRMRLSALSIQMRAGLWLIGGFPGGRAEEARTHAMFAHLRLPQYRDAGTEWFRPERELLDFIASLPALDAQARGEWVPQRYHGDYEAVRVASRMRDVMYARTG